MPEYMRVHVGAGLEGEAFQYAAERAPSSGWGSEHQYAVGAPDGG